MTEDITIIPDTKVKIITYVLDDDKEELELLRLQLEKVCGCDLQTYSDHKEFLAAIEQGVHVAIIDYVLNAPTDGIDIGAKVLSKNPLCYLVLFTGSQDWKVYQRAMNTGFKCSVYKNAIDSYERVANAVQKQLTGIVERIDIFNKWFVKAH